MRSVAVLGVLVLAGMTAWRVAVNPADLPHWFWGWERRRWRDIDR